MKRTDFLPALQNALKDMDMLDIACMEQILEEEKRKLEKREKETNLRRMTATQKMYRFARLRGIRLPSKEQVELDCIRTTLLSRREYERYKQYFPATAEKTWLLLNDCGADKKGTEEEWMVVTHMAVHPVLVFRDCSEIPPGTRLLISGFEFVMLSKNKACMLDDYKKDVYDAAVMRSSTLRWNVNHCYHVIRKKQGV